MNKIESKFEYEEALQNFLLDIDCLDELLPWTGKVNVFDILKVSRAEIRHSNMLGWLLDANENHGLGDCFLRGILQRLVENDSDGRYDVFKVLLMDLYSFIVYREWKNIDILLVSDEEKIVFAVENKIGSHEHSNQLKRYQEILEKDYSSYQKILVYLTPNGEEPSDIANWDILSYGDVVDVLAETYEKVKMQPEVDLMIRNYIEVIRRDVVEDQQLINICNKIYNKHQKALDLIFENRIDGKMHIKCAISNALCKLQDEGKIIYDETWGFNFRTAEMDKILPLLKESKSSWGTTNIYIYWLNYRDGQFYGIFELGGYNVPAESQENIQKMIDVMKPNDKKRYDFKYKRVYRTEWYNMSEVEDLENGVEVMVREAVDELLRMEKELIEQIIA